MTKIITLVTFFAATAISLSASTASLAFAVNKPNRKDTAITITIRLKNSAQKVLVMKAPLKYNKDFAFSLTFDDGLVSAYKVAFPLLNGGNISGKYIDKWKSDQGGDGSLSPGLFYSDGCGNRLPFKAAIAINAKGIEDDTVQDRGNLSWKEINEISGAGWSVMNHGYAHATKDGTNYYEEVIKNNDTVYSHTGVHLHQFVVPGGPGIEGYDQLYATAAFKAGMDAVGNVGGAGPIINVTSAINMHQLKYERGYATSNVNIKELYKNKENIQDSILRIVKYLPSGYKYWYNEFTHSAGNDNLWGISLKFETLNYYLKSLATQYGEQGTDNMWMAPFEEVYDYLRFRDAASLTSITNGDTLVITIKVPGDLLDERYKAFTLVIKDAAGFKVLKSDGARKISYNNTSAGLINIGF